MGELAKRFGERVRQLRASRSLTQAELADRASISEEWVRRIERGAASPSFEVVEALARALDVEPAVPIGAPKDGPAEVRLVARVRQLNHDEQEWMSGLLDQLLRRPRRL